MGLSTTITGSTPRQDGFFMPAEYTMHSGSWLLWPERPDNWRLNAGPAQQAIAALASAIAQFEPVHVGVSPEQVVHARAVLPPHICVVEMAYDDAWARDTGPSCVINQVGSVRGIDWIFNGWGGAIIPSWQLDQLVASRILDFEGLDRYVAPLVLEPGSIHVDGEGTLLTTEECLLNKNRNPYLSRGEIEQVLQEYLGIERILWLGHGIYLDETDGHVDNLCCWIRPGVVALNWTDDHSDPQYEISCEALERLTSKADALGRHLIVRKIHQPDPMYISEEEAMGLVHGTGSAQREAGQRIPGSYINYYAPNGAVIVPQFGDERHDREACVALQDLYPDRRIVSLPAREVVLGGGGFHCVLQQIPSPSHSPLPEGASVRNTRAKVRHAMLDRRSGRPPVSGSSLG